MRLEILAAESLGVRGLCCRVEAGERVIVIDPGVALGDHAPLLEANTCQPGFPQLPPRFKSLRAWSLSPEGQTHKSQTRARDLMGLLGTRFQVAEGLEDGPLSFSPAVPHGVGGLA